MALCKDPSLTFLNKFGYNVIKLPRVGIEPMDIVGRDSSTEWLGKLSRVWNTTMPPPEPGPPQPAANVQGQKSDKLELSVGLKILENALRAFGATVPSLAFAYNRARKIQFTFGNVTSTSVEPLAAGNYLGSGDLNTNNPVVSHYFLEDHAEAFLIFDVLKTTSIDVTATDDSGTEIKVDVPQIQATVGVNVGVGVSGSAQATLTFSGQTPVSFGFRAFSINFANGKWVLAGAQASDSLAFGVSAGGAQPTPASSLGQPVLLKTGGLLGLDR
jgi:hypothetical protein